MAYRCQLCTAWLDAGATICGQCGGNLERAVPMYADTQPPSPDCFINARRKNTSGKRGIVFLLALVGVVAFCIFCVHLGDSFGNPNASPFVTAAVPTTPQVSSIVNDLSVSVQYLGNQFYVSNRNGYNWKNVELTVLAKQWEYTEKIPQIKSNTVLVTDMRRFTCPDTGEHFNPEWIENPALRASVIHSGSVGHIEFRIDAYSGGKEKTWDIAENGGEVTSLAR